MVLSPLGRAYAYFTAFGGVLVTFALVVVDNSIVTRDANQLSYLRNKELTIGKKEYGLEISYLIYSA